MIIVEEGKSIFWIMASTVKGAFPLIVSITIFNWLCILCILCSYSVVTPPPIPLIWWDVRVSGHDCLLFFWLIILFSFMFLVGGLMQLIIIREPVFLPHRESPMQVLILLCDLLYILVEVLYLLFQNSDLGGLCLPFSLVVCWRCILVSLHHSRMSFDHAIFVLPKIVFSFP